MGTGQGGPGGSSSRRAQRGDKLRIPPGSWNAPKERTTSGKTQSTAGPVVDPTPRPAGTGRQEAPEDREGDFRWRLGADVEAHRRLDLCHLLVRHPHAPTSGDTGAPVPAAPPEPTD